MVAGEGEGGLWGVGGDGAAAAVLLLQGEASGGRERGVGALLQEAAEVGRSFASAGGGRGQRFVEVGVGTGSVGVGGTYRPGEGRGKEGREGNRGRNPVLSSGSVSGRRKEGEEERYGRRGKARSRGPPGSGRKRAGQAKVGRDLRPSRFRVPGDSAHDYSAPGGGLKEKKSFPIL